MMVVRHINRQYMKFLYDFHQLQNAKRGFGHWEASNGIRLMEKMEFYLQSNQVLYPGEGEKIITLMDEILKYALEKGQVKAIGSSLMMTVFDKNDHALDKNI